MNMGLLNALQAASNTTADAVAAPVDGLAWLLRRMGVPVDNPVGGSEWMRQQGLTATVQPGASKVVGETFGLLAPAAAAPQITAGLLRAWPEAKKAVSAMRSSGKIRAPAKVPERPFSYDYPNLPSGSAPGSPLTVDVDGRPLQADAIVAGRRSVGGPDLGISPEEAASIVQRFGIHAGNFGGTAPKGVAGKWRRDGGAHFIDIDPSLAPGDKHQVGLHELGHFIDDVAGDYNVALRGGQIDQTGVKKQLAQVFDDLNNGRGSAPLGAPRPAKKQLGPGLFGYTDKEAPGELMAEAIRAYMADPAYIKTVAPELAAKIRKAVNSNPALNRIVQFNTAAGAGLLGAGLLRQGEDPQMD